MTKFTTTTTTTTTDDNNNTNNNNNLQGRPSWPVPALLTAENIHYSLP